MKSPLLSFNIRKDKKCSVDLRSISGVLLEENSIYLVVDSRLLALEFSTKSEATKKYNVINEAWNASQSIALDKSD